MNGPIVGGLRSVRFSVIILLGSLLVSSPRLLAEAGDKSDDLRLDFPTRILPILTKAGCNAGACHGAAIGQGGLKLSLLGYDPEQDYETITREFSGRRVDLTAPRESLLLRKPTKDLRHKGGLKIRTGSADYQTLVAWLEVGAPYGPKELRVTQIEVRPADILVARPQESCQLRVTALLSNGCSEDVTPHALYNSNDDGIAQVDLEGRATVRDRGLTTIMVRYSGQVAAVRIGAPFQEKEIASTSFPSQNFIDDEVFSELKRLRIPPSPLCEDTEFLRRVYLDVLGRLPSANEVRTFLAASDTDTPEIARETPLPSPLHEPGPVTPALSPSAGERVSARTGEGMVHGSKARTNVSGNSLLAARREGEDRRFSAGPVHSTAATSRKREQVIDRLLGREEFVDLWTLRFADLLLINSKRLGEAPAKVYYAWLREQIATNAPFDQLVRELLTAKGDTATNGPANFYRLTRDPRDMGEYVSRTFLGIQVACARCHTHPFAGWTQNDYHRFAAFFVRTDFDDRHVFIKDQGEVQHPKTNKDVGPKPLGAREAAAGEDPDRRVALAAWITSPGNPWLAKSTVNRVWKYLLGRGLIEPVDDVRVTNPPSNPGLIEALAADFVKNGYDLRHLVRSILTSRVYQLASRSEEINRRDDRFFSHAYLKPLSAQVLADAIAQVTESPTEYAGYSPGTRAVQLIDSQTPSYTLDVFGRCLREMSCDARGQFGGGLSQALHLITGSAINEKLRQGIVDRLQSQVPSEAEFIEEIYLRTVSRPPSAAERNYCLQALAKSDVKANAAEDLLWALLNSREFAFNH